ncbi:carbohydrate binding domain-containing protein, partial [Taibaiella koreensis]|uniref:hypothetical protein n=1 Tax=Taibaiella koreensis TaxID=1268548 RepID=UPI0013C2F719
QDLDGTPASNKAQTEATRSGGGNGASSLYSPNLFDGSVDIRIPIYDYKTDNADLGVTLTYNTRGIKLDQLASSAGLGFAIKAEGSISRVVKGLPDELSVNLDMAVVYGNQTYTKARGRMANVMNGSSAAGAYLDSESDEFVVSAGNLSFSFMIGRGGQVFTIPQRGVQVKVLAAGASYWTTPAPPSQNLEFEITDEQGNRYYFVKGDYSQKPLYLDITKTTPGQELAQYWMTERWVVSKVTLADGKEIRYSYQASEGSRDVLYQSYNYPGLPQVPGGGDAYGPDFRSRLSSIRYPNGITANMVYNNTLSRCDLGSVSPGDRSILTEISVGTDYGKCLRYRLHQVYTVADPANLNREIPITDPCLYIYDAPFDNPLDGHRMPSYRNHRLRLKSITLMSCDGLQEEPYYSFEYDPQGLPPRFRGGQDWYGYYNGQQPVWTPFAGGAAYNPDMTIPLHSETRNGLTIQYGVNRNPNLSYTKAGSLRSVTNAYGGNTRFVYTTVSLNSSYSSYDPAIPSDGYFFNNFPSMDGLAVDSIIESEPFHPDNRRISTFQYLDGWAWFGGGYYHYPKSKPDLNQYPAAPAVFTGSRLSSQQQVNGSNHGFGTVRMYVRNNAGRQLSHREASFTTIYDASNGWQYRYLAKGKKYYQYPFTDKQYLRDWEIGLPVSIAEYDDMDNLVQTTQNRYNFNLLLDTLGGEALQVDGTHIVYVDSPLLNSGGKAAVSDYYKPYRGKSLLMSTIVKKNISYGAVIYDSVAYTYDSRSNLSRIITTNSEGEEVQTINYYNYDAGALDPLPGLEKLTTTQRWKRIPGNTGPLPQNGLLLDAFFHGSTKEGTAPAFEKIRDKNLYVPQSSQPQSYSSYLGTGSDNSEALKIQATYNNTALTGFRKASEVLRADAKGNPLETYLEQGQQYKAMIWDTATGNKLAEAIGCRYDELAYAGFEAKGNSNFQYNANAVSNFSNAPGGSNVYLLGGSNTIGRSGLTAGKTYFLSFWSTHTPTCSIGGSAISLTTGPVRDIWTYYEGSFTPNSSSDQFLLSRSVNCFIDEVRLHPVAAMVQSWNIDPLLGTTSATDARGRITYYEYDAMGRPYLVRDQEGHILSKSQYTIHGAE